LLNCQQLLPRFQVLYGFRFESPDGPFTAHPVLQSTARSEDRRGQNQDLFICPGDSGHVSGLPRILMIESFKELRGCVAFTMHFGLADSPFQPASSIDSLVRVPRRAVGGSDSPSCSIASLCHVPSGEPARPARATIRMVQPTGQPPAPHNHVAAHSQATVIAVGSSLLLLPFRSLSVSAGWQTAGFVPVSFLLSFNTLRFCLSAYRDAEL
jgi:hypothetical protein